MVICMFVTASFCCSCLGLTVCELCIHVQNVRGYDNEVEQEAASRFSPHLIISGFSINSPLTDPSFQYEQSDSDFIHQQ